MNRTVESLQQDLMNAAGNGDMQRVRLLLEQGADVNTRDVGHTALMWAARRGQSGVVRLLLEHGADITAHVGGTTALIEAAESLVPETVRLLLEHGADVTARDRDGDTALEHAELGYWSAWGWLSESERSSQECMQRLDQRLDEVEQLLRQAGATASEDKDET